MRAVLLVKEKMTEPDGSVIEVVVWKVPEDRRHPEGLRYRMAFISSEYKRPVVLYDNHHPKGHHKHIEGRENAYSFAGLERLMVDFYQDIDDWKRKRWPLH